MGNEHLKENNFGTLPSQETLYSETCKALVNYSAAILKVRTLSIAQGVAIAVAAGFMVKEGLWSYALGAAIAGILLTLTLWHAHRVYYAHLDSFLAVACALEQHWNLRCESERVWSNYFKLGGQQIQGPWTRYLEKRETRSNSEIWRFWLKNGVFIFLCVMLLVIAWHTSQAV